MNCRELRIGFVCRLIRHHFVRSLRFIGKQDFEIVMFDSIVIVFIWSMGSICKLHNFP